MKPPRVAPHRSETALSTACQARFKMRGGAVMKIHGSAAQTAGHPDLIGCLNGRFVAVELKQPGKRPTPLQMKRLREWAAAGGLAGWVTTEVEFDQLLDLATDLAWVNPQLVRDPSVA